MWVQCYVLISTCTPWIRGICFSLCKVFFLFSCFPLFLFFVAEFGVDEATPLIEGPSDTSEIHTGNLFRSTHLRENIVESTGPVLSSTVQMPQAAFKSVEPVTQPGKSLLSWINRPLHQKARMYFIDLSLFPVSRLHQNFILPELASLEQFCFSLLYKGRKV